MDALKRWLGGIMVLIVVAIIVFALGGCINSPASYNMSLYNRGGVIQSEALGNGANTNKQDEVWTDSRGGVQATVDPDLPALPALE